MEGYVRQQSSGASRESPRPSLSRSLRRPRLWPETISAGGILFRGTENFTNNTFCVWSGRCETTCFHGGKYPHPLEPMDDVARNRRLLEAAITVLSQCLELSEPVRDCTGRRPRGKQTGSQQQRAAVRA